MTEPTPIDAKDALRVLVANGLSFGEALTVFAESNDDRAEAYIAGAHEHHARDGEVEIDDISITSGSDDAGDYVLAWIWVTNEEAGLEDEDDDED